jgi:hypothetical protein
MNLSDVGQTEIDVQFSAIKQAEMNMKKDDNWSKEEFSRDGHVDLNSRNYPTL